ncbi:MAG: hypothetical protein AAFV49_15540, partial [Pseudomonadota bacterium]
SPPGCRAPLPRLGRGLLRIRQGRVAEGRREIEAAVALDPRRTALRAWLGRAYAAEGLSEKALSQYALAKEEDPDDPTPYLLSAEALFLENRPVEALAELRAAEARGDGRSVLRSERGLAEDRAVRGAALGRLYDLLGFTEEAVREGARAIEQDHANAAAQRVLADLLSDRAGREVARSSAELAAQVYSSPSTEPLDPTRAETELTLLDGAGATRPAFAELTPFFDSDGFRADLSGFGGTQTTFGNTASFTALKEGVSVGVGQFHYETEGYRENNEIRHTLGTAQIKAEVLPWLDVFGEYRYRFSEGGDRTLEFDLADVEPGLDQELERNVFRIGAHTRIGAAHDVAAVLTHSRQDETLTTERLSGSRDDLFTDGRAIDGQLQHVSRLGPLALVSGLAYADTESDAVFTFQGANGEVFTRPLFEDTEQFTAYSYAMLSHQGLGPVGPLELTLGGSVDHFDLTADAFNTNDRFTVFNPKIGARIGLPGGLTLRGAWTKTVTPEEIAQQRLEPVTVAGFTQFADQPGGTRVSTAGIGLDAKPLPWLSLGAEGVRRRIEAVVLSAQNNDTEEFEVSAFANATFARRFSAGLKFRRIDTEAADTVFDLDAFRSTEFTGTLGWFHPQGWFLSGEAGVGFHRFEFQGAADEDTFPILKLSAGYRLPERRGVLSLDLSNVIDSDFGFQDRPLQSNFLLARPRFAREFTAIGRLTLSF